LWFKKKNGKKKTGNYEGNDLFVTLVEMAMEGDETGDMIRTIINLNDAERLMVIATVSNQLKQNNAPDDLLNAFLLLQNREVVRNVRGIIYDEE